MPTPVIIKYPYDPTGEAETNFVAGELHSIPRSASRAFALYNGPFFANSVRIQHLASGDFLEKGTDFETLYLYELATKKVNQPITAVIYVTNPAYHGQLSVDYQVVGGEFANNMSAIQQLIQSLEIDNRAIVWGDILDKPVRFPAAPHLHHVGDLYGMEALIDVLTEMKEIMQGGNELVLQNMVDQINATNVRLYELEQAVQELQM